VDGKLNSYGRATVREPSGVKIFGNCFGAGVALQWKESPVKRLCRDWGHFYIGAPENEDLHGQ